ncbi:CU044_5270 family protein [Nonomuraea sp. NPDC049607]|uniref:CU044_5270 family protein n=1 Tax=Nonomuraea sp. NPDC049607 TaxID=3154732 RepID=UPI00341A63C2
MTASTSPVPAPVPGSEEIEGDRAGLPRPARSPRRPLHGLPGGRWTMRVGAAMGLAAAVTAGLVVVRGDHDSAPFGAAPAGAAELLRNAALVAVREETRPGGQFLYVDQKAVTRGSGSEGEYTQDVRRELWLPGGNADKALTRSTYGQTHVTDGRDPMHLQSPGTVEYERAGQCRTGGSARLPQADELPVDPDQALAKVRQDAEAFVRSDQSRRAETNLGADEIEMRVEKTVGSQLFRLVENPLASSGTRSTVFGALSRMPNVTIVPDLTDSAGRHGVGASLKLATPDGGWERGELIFEPGTYRFLGCRSWLGQPQGGQVKETPRSSMAVMTVKVVDSMPEVPKNAGKPLFC